MCHPEICHLKCLENARTLMKRRGMFTSETRGLSEGVGSVRKVSAVQNLRGEIKLTEKFIWWEVATSFGAKGFTIDRSIVWSLREKRFKLRCKVSNSCHLMRCWWWCAEMITENKSKGRLNTNDEVEMSKRLFIDLVFQRKGYWMGDRLYDWQVGWDSKWIKFGWKVSSCLTGWEGWRGGRWSDVASSSSSIAPDNTALGHYFKNMQDIMQQITGTHLRGLPAAHWSFHAQVDLGGNLVSIAYSSTIHQQ